MEIGAENNTAMGSIGGIANVQVLLGALDRGLCNLVEADGSRTRIVVRLSQCDRELSGSVSKNDGTKPPIRVVKFRPLEAAEKSPASGRGRRNRLPHR